MSLCMSVCTCCVVHSSCRCCACCWPTFQGESASEPAPGSHTHPGANERSYAPSCGLHQAAQCRQPHAYCRKTNRKRPQKHTQLSSIQTPPFNQVTNEDETQKHHVDFCSLSSSPPVPQQNRQARRVNPTGQCCPTERCMLAWQTLPPGGLGINRSPAGSWFSIPLGVMGAGSSDETTSVVHQTPFMASTAVRAYLLSALTAVWTIPLISASFDHTLVHLDHCCHPNSLSLNCTLCYLSVQITLSFSPGALTASR